MPIAAILAAGRTKITANQGDASMAAVQIEGYVTVFEASDGGSGDPRKTTWQFFIDPGNAPRDSVITTNSWIAETMHLAIKTNSRVRTSYDSVSHVASQARIEFAYVCESVRLE